MKSVAIWIFLAALAAATTVAGDTGKLEPNIIRWATASEKDNFGYDVYRGPTKAGPFKRINPKTIPGAGTTDLPHHYEYVDRAIDANTVYWYYIESISLNGERKRMTPIYPSQLKAPKPPSRLKSGEGNH